MLSDKETNVVPPTPGRLYTYEELVAEMPESTQPCELWDGELVMSPTPSFHHQQIAFRFHQALNTWVLEHQLGEVVGAPIDMVLSPHRAVQPDVAYISKARLSIIERVIMGAADLVAEVISPGGRHRDRIDKKDLYEQHGVQEYWIIDPEPETVEVLFLEAGQYKLVTRCSRTGIASSRLLPGFEIMGEKLFGLSR